MLSSGSDAQDLTSVDQTVLESVAVPAPRMILNFGRRPVRLSIPDPLPPSRSHGRRWQEKPGPPIRMGRSRQVEIQRRTRGARQALLPVGLPVDFFASGQWSFHPVRVHRRNQTHVPG